MTKSVHIFDMDDTLLVTPTFSDILKQGSNEHLDGFLKNLKQVFLLFISKDVSFLPQGDFIVLTTDGGYLPAHVLITMREKMGELEAAMKPEAFKKQFGIKRSSVKDAMKALDIRDGRVIVAQVMGFHENPRTIGSIPNEPVIEAYRRAENKMIVTGRKEGLKRDIMDRLEQMGIEYPNYGLYCSPVLGSGSIAEFKAKVILDSIGENDWEEVHFYEDREDWLKKVAKEVREMYVNVSFVEHHIDNIHRSKRL